MGSRIFILKKTAIVVLVAALSILSQACSDIDDCFRGSGSPDTDIRFPGAFDRIYLTDNIDLRVHISQSHQVNLNGGHKLLPQVETEVKDGTLRILNGNRCNWTRDFKDRIVVDVYTPELKSIFVEDAIGNIAVADTIQTDEFRLDSYSSMGSYELKLDCMTATLAIHNGSADLKVSGSAETQFTYSAGYGVADATDFKTVYAFITNKGTNDIKVDPVTLLDVNIEGSGNIYYRGQPDSIRSSITGTGKLIKL